MYNDPKEISPLLTTEISFCTSEWWTPAYHIYYIHTPPKSTLAKFYWRWWFFGTYSVSRLLEFPQEQLVWLVWDKFIPTKNSSCAVENKPFKSTADAFARFSLTFSIFFTLSRKSMERSAKHHDFEDESGDDQDLLFDESGHTKSRPTTSSLNKSPAETRSVVCFFLEPKKGEQQQLSVRLKYLKFLQLFPAFKFCKKEAGFYNK